MGRDVMPELYQHSLEESADRYATVFLRAIGVAEGGLGPGVKRQARTARPGRAVPNVRTSRAP